MRKMALVNMIRAGLVIAALGLGSITAMADQWTGGLTLTAAHAEDDSNVLHVYVTTSQAVVNPANCSATDGYIAEDPVITNQTLSIALTALSTGAPIEIYVSGSQCSQNRPVILSMQIY